MSVLAKHQNALPTVYSKEKVAGILNELTRQAQRAQVTACSRDRSGSFGKTSGSARDSQSAGSSPCAERQADFDTSFTTASICWTCFLPLPGESCAPPAPYRRPWCAPSPAQQPSARPRSPLPVPVTSGACRRPRHRRLQRARMDQDLPRRPLQAQRRLL
jgi:hypothetical protein